MNCPKCGRDIGKIKKNDLFDCQCGAKLLAVEISKKLMIQDLSKDKGDNQ